MLKELHSFLGGCSFVFRKKTRDPAPWAESLSLDIREFVMTVSVAALASTLMFVTP